MMRTLSKMLALGLKKQYRQVRREELVIGDPNTPQSQSASIPASRDQMTSTIHPFRTSRLAQAPKRPTNRSSILSENTSIKDGEIKNEKASPKPLRKARRGTLYIPTEDTTMPSMYMGIFSPIKNFHGQAEGHGEHQSSVDMTGIAAQMAVKRGSRKSIMGVAPRRVPLQSPSRTIQETATVVDRYGQGGGKENVPPGMEECEKLMLDLKLDGIKGLVIRMKASPQRAVKTEAQPSTRSSAFAPTVASLHRANPRISTKASPVQSSSNSNRLKPSWNTGSRQNHMQHLPVPVKHEEKPLIDQCTEKALKAKVPSRFVVPVVKPDYVFDKHVLLSENIARPDMYEDNWLSHQEIAITQLVNSLFDSSKRNIASSNETPSLRQQLLDIYGTNSMLLMYKRLNASLLYGSLGIPQEILSHGESLFRDVGRKQQFMDLWLQTYNHEVLEIALEVVVGRQCRPARARVSGTSTPLRPIPRKTLQSYIEIFLIGNEDGCPDEETPSRASWSYQRTMHRSLMLIKVLDLTKTDSGVHVPTCLFQSSSAFKSSMAVVQSLFQMLNTSAGDPIRALGHLGYHVIHTQFPLDEFQHTIENLAIDIRDGTRLTRLVELLLHPSASRSLDKVHDPEATTTVMMREGETFNLQNGCNWPLSQHLKFPCQARTQMLWNVQIALSAIRNVKGMTSLIEGITAEDIVNGYREKTIRLLWALVGKWGLTSLLDWEDLKWETRRLCLQINAPYHAHDDNADDEDPTQPSFTTCTSTLKRWARIIASSSNIPVQNFTTSFADGKIFEAIVDEYEPFLLSSTTSSTNPSKTTTTTTTHPHTTLQTRLTNLGCSHQFSHLFSPNAQPHIFNRDFVLAALAFLASRLLPPSRRGRRAVVIQRCWRGYWGKVVEGRKEGKRELARACRDFVWGKLGGGGEEGLSGGKDGREGDSVVVERGVIDVGIGIHVEVGNGNGDRSEVVDGSSIGDDGGIDVTSPGSGSVSVSESDIWLSL